jgi:PAS domain S-box-containing protein/putative nucleotidyltransferase with HDIG domain
MASAIGVLVADEDARVRESVAEFLETNGYEPLPAATAPAALAILAERPIAVALFSTGLPGFPGEELMGHIATRAPLSETLILADHPAALEQVQPYLAGGAFGYVRKPVNAADLLLNVRNAAKFHGVRSELARHGRADVTVPEAEAQYRALFESSRDGIVVVEAATGRVADVNPRLVELFGYPREAYVGLSLAQCGPLRDIGACQELFDQLQEQDAAVREVCNIALVGGTTLDAELRGNRCRVDGVPGRWMQFSFRDITAEHRQEGRMRRINAFFSAIRRISEYLLVAQSEDEIYRFICATIGELEHVAGVWIGLKLPDYTVLPVAWAGFDDDTVANFQARWDQNGSNYGIMGTAIREGRPVIVHDAANDRRYASWQTMLGRWGIRSGLGAPLITDGETIGSITIFSDQPYAFDEEAARFLGDIAADAAVGVRSLRLDKKLRATLNSLRMSLDGTVEAIARMVELRDPYTAGHQRRVAQLASAIGRELGLPERRIEGLRVAGYLHDIGKIGIPAEILAKTTHLSDYEFGIVKGHSLIGYEILKNLDFPWPVAQTVLQHHERMDGSGYPDGIGGDAIILEARILMVADVVEAMMGQRPYRSALDAEAAMWEIRQRAAAQFDTEVVTACARLFGERGFEFLDSGRG